MRASWTVTAASAMKFSSAAPFAAPADAEWYMDATPCKGEADVAPYTSMRPPAQPPKTAYRPHEEAGDGPAANDVSSSELESLHRDMTMHTCLYRILACRLRDAVATASQDGGPANK